MAILPAGSTLTITSPPASGSYILTALEVIHIPTSELFDRTEFSHARLLNAKNQNGSMPIYQTQLGGAITQWISLCNPQLARDVTPDDTVLASIKQKFTIDRFQIKIDATLSSQTDPIYEIAASHKILFDTFTSYLQIVQMDLSYPLLKLLQTVNLQNLFNGTATVNDITIPGISIAGSSLGSISNYFIRELQESVEYQINYPNLLLKTLTLTCDNLTLSTADTMNLQGLV